MTPKERLWALYHKAVKAGNQVEAERLLKLIHQQPRGYNPAPRAGGGCGRCRKRYR